MAPTPEADLHIVPLRLFGPVAPARIRRASLMPVFRSLPLPTVRTVEPYVSRGEMPDTYPAGRPCHEPGCITRLNRYNPGPFCLLHADTKAAEVVASGRGRRRRVRHRTLELAA